jgi:acetate kinase
MKILVINCGSSSLKFQLLDMNDESVLAKGIVERIGSEGTSITCETPKNGKIRNCESAGNHTDAASLVFKYLSDEKTRVIKNANEIDAIGHRLVHGGEVYNSSVLIDDKVVEALKKYSVFAPLHNPANILGIEACKNLLPDVPMAGTFDTAFHQTMPDYAFMYALPYSIYEKHKIRKYGFHGTSHRYVSGIAAKELNKNNPKIISCHLGNGSSICAVCNGKSVDTSMGYTPVDGLVMGTRCGDLDPAIVNFIEKEEQMSHKEVDDMLNKKSGVYGISGISNDFRDLENALHDGNKRAKLALEIFDFRLRKYIGAYTAIMGGLDALVFTAGIGENDWETRYFACKDLEYLGIEIDENRNKTIRGNFADISLPGSKVRIYVIPTNEELMIARDTKEIVSALK